MHTHVIEFDGDRTVVWRAGYKNPGSSEIHVIACGVAGWPTPCDTLAGIANKRISPVEYFGCVPKEVISKFYRTRYFWYAVSTLVSAFTGCGHAAARACVRELPGRDI
jgi:hypothetical protein